MQDTHAGGDKYFGWKTKSMEKVFILEKSGIWEGNWKDDLRDGQGIL